MKKHSITVLMDCNCIEPDNSEFHKESDVAPMEYAIIKALRDMGHLVTIVGVENDIEAIVKGLSDNQPDIVFNLAESYRDQRKFDKNVAGLLELLGVPFTGTGSTGLMLCRDKALCKSVMSAHSINVPMYAVFEPQNPVVLPAHMRFPIIVKPLYGDGSDGISNGSLVKSEDDLVERIRHIHERFKEPAIAEEFIEGRELYVGILGNRHARVLPVRELHFGNEGGPVIATYKVKWDKGYQKKWNISYGFGDLEPSVEEKVRQVCRDVFRCLQMVDYGRIDLRLTPENEVFVLEANPNPAIGPEDDVTQAAARIGIDFCNLVEKILSLALQRFRKI